MELEWYKGPRALRTSPGAQRVEGRLPKGGDPVDPRKAPCSHLVCLKRGLAKQAWSSAYTPGLKSGASGSFTEVSIICSGPGKLAESPGDVI
jgi:hypothetical protein